MSNHLIEFRHNTSIATLRGAFQAEAELIFITAAVDYQLNGHDLEKTEVIKTHRVTVTPKTLDRLIEDMTNLKKSLDSLHSLCEGLTKQTEFITLKPDADESDPASTETSPLPSEPNENPVG